MGSMKGNEGIHRHDISDEAWELIKDLLPGQAEKHGGAAKDNRLFINTVAWQTRTGTPRRGYAARIRELEQHA